MKRSVRFNIIVAIVLLGSNLLYSQREVIFDNHKHKAGIIIGIGECSLNQLFGIACPGDNPNNSGVNDCSGNGLENPEMKVQYNYHVIFC